MVSFCTDIASEMLYPVMPIFLKHIGYSVVFIGFLEGLAEAIAGLSKAYFGKSSDQQGKRLPFVRAGYALSALSKPLMAFFLNPIWILLCRSADRLGKGIRTGARDAILSDEATPESKARVFGFHRSWDTLGAVLGPALALVYLFYFPLDYTKLFIIAFVPGIFSIGFTYLIKEKTKAISATAFIKPKFFGFLSYWKESSTAYQQLVKGLLIFAVFNSPDVFLLLKMKEIGISDTAVIAVYIFYNLVYAIMAYPAGVLADKMGMKKILMIGLVLYAIVYAGFAWGNNLPLFIGLWMLYGCYAAATEGIAKAWISNIADKKDTATAIGTYSGLQSIAALIAGSLTGIFWYTAGSTFSLMLSALAAVLVVVYLGLIQFKRVN
jgi:MFS family permease